MPVDNVGVLFIQTKFPQDPVDHFLVVKQPVIGVLRLLVRLLVFQEIPLKRRHLIFAEHRRIGACPDIPDNVLPL